MSLESEISAIAQLEGKYPIAKLYEQLADNASAGDQAFVALKELVIPILGQYREALLRLAREIDALRDEGASA